MKKIIFLLSVFALIASGLLWKGVKHSATSALHEEVAPMSGLPGSQLQMPGGKTPIINSTSNLNLNVSKEFKNFISEEAVALNLPHVDPTLAEQRVKAQIEKMGPAELEFARSTALSTQSPATHRIMAVYLLAGGNEKSWTYLKDIALVPGASVRAEPHSIDEVKNAQSKAFSIMAIDSLAKQATTNLEAREELQRWGNEAQDPTIKKYIQQKLKELPPPNSVQ